MLLALQFDREIKIEAGRRRTLVTIESILLGTELKF